MCVVNNQTKACSNIDLHYQVTSSYFYASTHLNNHHLTEILKILTLQVEAGLTCINILAYPSISLHIHQYPYISINILTYPSISLHIHQYPYISINIHAYPIHQYPLQVEAGLTCRLQQTGSHLAAAQERERAAAQQYQASNMFFVTFSSQTRIKI